MVWAAPVRRSCAGRRVTTAASGSGQDVESPSPLSFASNESRDDAAKPSNIRSFHGPVCNFQHSAYSCRRAGTCSTAQFESPSAAPPASEPAGAPTTPDLAVASVKLQGGSRVSKLIGSAVYNDQNEKVGSVDDLIMKDGNRIVMAVVSVGGSAAAPVAPDCCPSG